MNLLLISADEKRRENISEQLRKAGYPLFALTEEDFLEDSSLPPTEVVVYDATKYATLTLARINEAFPQAVIIVVKDKLPDDTIDVLQTAAFLAAMQEKCLLTGSVSAEQPKALLDLLRSRRAA